jgi:uncharacterized delta-60 repeat protein
MKGKILAIIFLINFTPFLSLNAQWARTYGGSEDDFAYSVQQTTDGGYIVAGVTDSFFDESGDIWILKLASDGTIEWQKTYGRGLGDGAYFIQQTSDGGYVVAGYYPSVGWNIWVLKLSSDGNIEWQKYYRGNYDGEMGRSIQQTTDGGYIVASDPVHWDTPDYDYDISVSKLTSNGDIEWYKTYRGSENDNAYSIQQTTDGGYVVAGETESFGAGNSDIWILKLASDGTIEWQKTYGGYASDGASSIQQTVDGGYVVAGQSISFGTGISDIWVLKLASDGTVEWQKTYGGSQKDEAYSVQQTSDGGYVVAGQTDSFGAGNADIWILKLVSDGTIEWQKTYGGYASDTASSIQQTIDGGYIVAGITETYGVGMPDILILKLSSNGDIDPACNFVNESNADVSDSSISPTDTDIIPVNTDIVLQDTSATTRESDAIVYSLCSGQRTLSLSATSGGTTNPQPGTYAYDHATRITIRAIPDEEYHFSEWSGDVSGTDNQLSITMDSDKSIQANFVGYEVVEEEAKKTPCFIATAAYESPSHPHVRVLQDFRDKYLMTNTFGLELVNVYYKYSPFMANLIETNKRLKVVVRIYFLPLVAICFSMVNFGPIITGGIFLLILMLPIFFMSALRRKRC